MPFSLQRLEFPDVILIEANAFADERGFLMETYKKSDFEEHGIPHEFKQDNYSLMQRGVAFCGDYTAKRTPRRKARWLALISCRQGTPIEPQSHES